MAPRPPSNEQNRSGGGSESEIASRFGEHRSAPTSSSSVGPSSGLPSLMNHNGGGRNTGLPTEDIRTPSIGRNQQHDNGEGGRGGATRDSILSRFAKMTKSPASGGISSNNNGASPSTTTLSPGMNTPGNNNFANLMKSTGLGTGIGLFGPKTSNFQENQLPTNPPPPASTAALEEEARKKSSSSLPSEDQSDDSQLKRTESLASRIQMQLQNNEADY